MEDGDFDESSTPIGAGEALFPLCSRISTSDVRQLTPANASMIIYGSETLSTKDVGGVS